MKEIKTKLLNDQDINELLKEFKQALNERKDYFTFNHRYSSHGLDIEEQAVYTSSSDFNGIYYPNNEIIINNKNYDFICLAINEETNEKGFIYNFTFIKKDGSTYEEFYFQPFKTLIYDQNELIIMEDLNKTIKQYEKEIKTLESIKRVYKKDGGDFANLSKNYNVENGSIQILTSYKEWYKPESRYNAEINLYKSFGYCNYSSFTLNISKDSEININDIEQSLIHNLELKKQYLIEYKEKLNSLHRVFKEVKRLSKQIKKVVDESNLYYAFYNYFDKLIKF